jgi:4-carboxymuconolactone decarboxylase
MSRLEPLDVESLDPADRHIIESIAGTRKGGLVGPFSVLAYNPRVAVTADALHNSFRLEGKLDRRLFELMVSAIAREFGAPYAWQVHARLARKAGLDTAIIENLLAQTKPESLQEDERLIYELTVDLLRNRSLTPDNYARGKDVLGVELLVEVVAAVGFYSMLCLVLNAFDVKAVDGFRFGAPEYS